MSPDEVDELGFLKTARFAGLESLDDIEIDDYVEHPLSSGPIPLSEWVDG